MGDTNTVGGDTMVREETKTSDNSYLFRGGVGWQDKQTITLTIPTANLKIDYAPPKRVIAIIPARGNSKSIPKKNMRLFRGKPLVQHTIEASLNAKSITKTVVTTEDEEIANLASGLGVQRVINRPAYLSQDHIQVEETVLQAFRELEYADREKIDILVVLQPTSPLRTSDDIDRAVDVFCDIGLPLRLVISGCDDNRYHWEKSTNLGGYLTGIPVVHDPIKQGRLGRQEQPFRMFVENGSIYVLDPVIFSQRRTFWYTQPFLYVMSQENEIELDEMKDWDALA